MAEAAAGIITARIKSSLGKQHFVSSPDASRAECPSESIKCRETAYLVAGDVVVALPQMFKGFHCATFVNKSGKETSGWLPAGSLTQFKAAGNDDKAWLGAWRRTEATIKITRGKRGGLEIEGDATFGASDPRRVASGGVNMGDFGGPARRQGDVVLVAGDDIPNFEAAPKDRCAVQMRRVGPYLVVEDNQGCGGMNVSFTGVYVR